MNLTSIFSGGVDKIVDSVASGLAELKEASALAIQAKGNILGV